MLCQECKQRNATIIYKKLIHGEKREFHLCEICAGKKEPYHQQVFNINQFLSGLLELEKGNQGFTINREEELSCNGCGMTYMEFKKFGRFGCSQCYETFREKITPLLRKIHGNEDHRGKIPKRGGGNFHLKQKVRHKKLEMKQAIEKENFEDAARLRDEIQALEQEID